MGPEQSPNKITQIGRGEKTKKEGEMRGMGRGQFYGKRQQIYK